MFFNFIAAALFCFISPFAFSLVETQPTPRTLWLDSLNGENMKLFIDKEEIKKLNFPPLSVKASEIYAGQLLAISDDDLIEQGPSHSTPLDENLSDKIFYVIRAGTKERPFFQLVGGHNRVLRALQDDPEVTINVQVIKDVTDFSHLEQGEILSMFGHFWSPENQNGGYRKLLISEMETSPWRTLAKIKWIRKRFEHLWEKRLAFTEIEFGRQIFAHLINHHFSKSDLLTTKQVIEAIQSLEGCESSLTE